MNLLELVAHNLNTFSAEIKSILSDFPEIDGINIPDITTLPIRADISSKVLLKEGVFTVTHLRSQDRSIQGTVELVKELFDLGLTKVLLLSGDTVSTTVKVEDSGTVLEQIAELKKNFPTLKVYGALDPYRNTIKDELNYCEEKIKIGCDGFFTQPFFDVNLAKFYLNQLKGTEVFLGISPVLTESNFKYWQNKNMVKFPLDFPLDLDFHCQLARDLMLIAKEYQQSTYLMPILAPVKDYLKGIFELEAQRHKGTKAQS